MSKDDTYCIFVYRIYEGFHIILYECSMYRYNSYLSGCISKNSHTVRIYLKRKWNKWVSHLKRREIKNLVEIDL